MAKTQNTSSKKNNRKKTITKLKGKSLVRTKKITNNKPTK